MQDAVRFPLDFDALDKGSIITAGTIEAITGVSPDSARYSGKQVKLATLIKRELEDRNKLITVACVNAEIHVLTDEAALPCNKRRARQGMRLLGSSFRDMASIDPTNLSPAAQRKRRRELENLGAIRAAIKEAKEEIRIAHRKEKPRMIGR